MTEAPRRPILKLKIAPPPKPAADEPAPKPKAGVRMPVSRSMGGGFRAPHPPPPPAPAHPWKCKPCGTGFEVAAELTDEDWVRCPACNARLGRAGDFRADPPNLEKLRARSVRRD